MARTTDKDAAYVNAEHAAGVAADKLQQKSRKDRLRHFFRAGHRLLKKKADLPHGQFMKWMKENLTFSGRTARRYLAFAERVKMETVSILDVDRIEGIWASTRPGPGKAKLPKSGGDQGKAGRHGGVEACRARLRELFPPDVVERIEEHAARQRDRDYVLGQHADDSLTRYVRHLLDVLAPGWSMGTLVVDVIALDVNRFLARRILTGRLTYQAGNGHEDAVG